MEDSRQLMARGETSPALRFAPYGSLTVRQRKRWLELLLSFEMKNTYDVYDEAQMPVLRVREEGSGFLSLLKRIFLTKLRPFSATVVEFGSEAPVLRLRRPFRFIFHRLEVTSPSGQPIGAIQRRWSWLRRLYVIEGSDGATVAELFGPILRPWTFEVRIGGQPRGLIQKKWSGLLKEAFTDADNFRVTFGDIDDPTQKALTFAATVLLDVVHFERGKG